MGKKKLTLSIEENIIKSMKHIAISEDTNLSELVEEYFRAVKKNKEVISAIQNINKK